MISRYVLRTRSTGRKQDRLTQAKFCHKKALPVPGSQDDVDGEGDDDVADTAAKEEETPPEDDEDALALTLVLTSCSIISEALRCIRTFSPKNYGGQSAKSSPVKLLGRTEFARKLQEQFASTSPTDALTYSTTA